jgi:hypothetical protein
MGDPYSPTEKETWSLSWTPRLCLSDWTPRSDTQIGSQDLCPRLVATDPSYRLSPPTVYWSSFLQAYGMAYALMQACGWTSYR